MAAMQHRWLAGQDRGDDLAQWAGRLALSPRTLQRRILATTGMPFRIWRQRVIMTASFDPLVRGIPVKIVAADAGYASASAFVAAFRRVFGVTPGELGRMD